MNCIKNHVIDLKVAPSQTIESIEAVFHTILMNRVRGKLNYKTNSNFEEYNLDYEDVDCDYIDDLTYVRISSKKLVSVVRSSIVSFAKDLCCKGEINLEFGQKRSISPNAVGMVKYYQQTNNKPVAWEKWKVRVSLMENCIDRLSGEEMAEHLMKIATDTWSAAELYLPKMPMRKDLDMVFDLSYDDCSPYLFNIGHAIDEQRQQTVNDVVSAITYNIRRMLNF